MADDEEDDYMADLSRFIPNEGVSRPAEGRHPKPSSVNKEKLSWNGKRKARQEQRKNDEESHRKEGLETAIPASNIGFKMLQQMGYTPGGALGKHGQGRVDPVNVDLKRSRTGLGRDDALKEQERVRAKRAEVEVLVKTQQEKTLRAVFQDRRRGSWHSRKIASDYRKACATLAQLEEAYLSSTSSNGKPAETASASQDTEGVKARNGDGDTAETQDAEEEEEPEITPEMLLDVLQKLRDQYNYCLYCGFKYDSAAALLASCPGVEDDDH